MAMIRAQQLLDEAWSARVDILGPAAAASKPALILQIHDVSARGGCQASRKALLLGSEH
jgi:hypothetical protein